MGKSATGSAMEIRGRWRPWENPQLDRQWKSEGAGAHGKIRIWIGLGNPRALAPMGKSTSGLAWKSEGAGTHGKIRIWIGNGNAMSIMLNQARVIHHGFAAKLLERASVPWSKHMSTYDGRFSEQHCTILYNTVKQNTK